MDRNGNKAVLYQNLAIEPTASRNDSEKQLLTYDQSLARLRKAGYQRHLRPAEAFGLLADSLEGKLDEGLQSVARNMVRSLYGEWLSMAMERQGDILICYLDPQGLEWNGSSYVKTTSFSSSETRQFSVAGKSSEPGIDLEEFDDDLVVALYGYSWKDLPQKMKTGDRKAKMCLPSEGVTWPVARGGFGVGCYSYDGASRGGSLRWLNAPNERAKNSKGNKSPQEILSPEQRKYLGMIEESGIENPEELKRALELYAAARKLI